MTISMVPRMFQSLLSCTSDLQTGIFTIWVQPLTRPHRIPRLHRDADRDSDVGIPAVVQVVAVIYVDDINVIVVLPVIPPVFRPRVNGTDPIATVLEARISANNQEGQAVDSKPMLRPKVSTETVVRDAVTVVAPRCCQVR